LAGGVWHLLGRVTTSAIEVTSIADRRSLTSIVNRDRGQIPPPFAIDIVSIVGASRE